MLGSSKILLEFKLILVVVVVVSCEYRVNLEPGRQYDKEYTWPTGHFIENSGFRIRFRIQDSGLDLNPEFSISGFKV